MRNHDFRLQISKNNLFATVILQSSAFNKFSKYETSKISFCLWYPIEIIIAILTRYRVVIPRSRVKMTRYRNSTK